MPNPISSNAQALTLGAQLVTQLISIRQARRAGASPPEISDQLGAWEQARDRWWNQMAQSDGPATPMRLIRLQKSYGLSAPELDLVLIALTPEIDPEFLDHLDRPHETFFFRGVDADLALSLRFSSLDEQFAARALLSADGRLCRFGLLSLRPIESRLNPHELELHPTEALANFVLDRSPLAGSLSRYCELTAPKHTWAQVIVPKDRADLLWEIVSGRPELSARLDAWGYADVLPGGRGLTLLFAGPPGTGKTALAHALAHRLGWRVLAVHTSHLAASREPIQPLLRDLMHVAELHRALLLLDDCESLLGGRDARFLAMLESLDANPGIVVLTTNLATEIDFAVGRRVQCRLDFEPPTAFFREQIWELHLPPDAPLSSDIDIQSLAAAYEFTGGIIRNTVLVALSRMVALKEDTLTMARLRESCEAQLGAHFDDMAVRHPVRGRLDALVLPDPERQQLQEVIDACRCHDEVMTRWGFGQQLTTGRGICVLFDGPPGTGKTYTAELLSLELKLPLYRVHIPNVVSKWVGETERNIAEIFVRARASRAVLLFDEADSLFGKRSTSQQSSNDRYANMEVNLLLQEIERYDGITILTTNLFGNLDDALQRRIQFRISFPFPTPPDRARIWRTLIPAQAPLDADIRFDLLGRRYELAGGHIKNAVLRASYRACAQKTAITQAHLAQAAIAECQAQGKLVRDTAISIAATGSRGPSPKNPPGSADPPDR